MARIIMIHDDESEVETRVVIEPSSNGTPPRITSIHIDALNGGAIQADDLLALESFNLRLPRQVTAHDDPMAPRIVAHPHEDTLPENPVATEPTRPVGGSGASTVDTDASGPPSTTDPDESAAVRAWAMDNGIWLSDRGQVPNVVLSKYRERESGREKRHPFLEPRTDDAGTPDAEKSAQKEPAQETTPITPRDVANRIAKDATTRAQLVANNGRKPKPTNDELAAQFKRVDGDIGMLAEFYGVDRGKVSSWLFAARKAGTLAPASGRGPRRRR